MPIDAYYRGSGSQVLATMREKYGNAKGTSVFYATANKNPAMKPKSEGNGKYRGEKNK